jgi:methylmalonyl-CoA/ethylmalonyl-CoA epimerase
MSQAKFGKIDQIGIVVADIDAGIETWTQRLGVGPCTLYKNVRITGEFRGQPCSVTFEVALGYQGEMQIELMQMTNDAPSPYRGKSGNLLLGMHHIAWHVDSLEASIEQAMADGMRLVFKGGNPSTRVAYMEIDDQPGMMFEFIESAQTRELMKAGIAATRNWDGTNPITVFDLAAV